MELVTGKSKGDHNYRAIQTKTPWMGERKCSDVCGLILAEEYVPVNEAVLGSTWIQLHLYIFI